MSGRAAIRASPSAPWGVTFVPTRVSECKFEKARQMGEAGVGGSGSSRSSHW